MVSILEVMGKYCNLCIESDALLLPDKFESFRTNNIGICNVDLAQDFITSNLTKDKSTLSDTDMLLMIKEGIRGRIRHANHRHTVANNSYMDDHDKSKGLLYVLHGDVNNLYGWAM